MIDIKWKERPLPDTHTYTSTNSQIFHILSMKTQKRIISQSPKRKSNEFKRKRKMIFRWKMEQQKWQPKRIRISKIWIVNSTSCISCSFRFYLLFLFRGWCFSRLWSFVIWGCNLWYEWLPKNGIKHSQNNIQDWKVTVWKERFIIEESLLCHRKQKKNKHKNKYQETWWAREWWKKRI